jgi:FkbM family methyltransferase
MGVAAYGKAILGSMLTARRVKRESALPEPLKSEVVSTLFQLSRMPRLPSTVSVVGYQVLHRGDPYMRFLFNEIFVQACYFFQTGNSRPVIFDCGSNIGMSILFFKKLYPDAVITGFEPDPVTFDTLNTNVTRNALSNVTIHRLALGDRDETRKFYRAAERDQSDLTMSTLKDRNSGSELTVECRRLSPFIVDEVDLLKIDIEGAEHQVLLELASSGKLQLIKKMHIEYHHHIAREEDTLSKTIRLLEDEGFGYQLKADSWPWPTPGFQDVSIYCYRKPKSARSS